MIGSHSHERVVQVRDEPGLGLNWLKPMKILGAGLALRVEPISQNQKGKP